ncbi:MAG: hypothetical protein IPP94_04710 [Ignavibacteria bacterium]|nr:hypothetical protein [Ignavibacteria bacterium]
MNATRRLLVWLPLLAVFSAGTMAQPTEASDVYAPGHGLFAAYDLNWHRADFRGLPGAPSCCPRYETGDGTGFSFGVFYRLPLERTLAIDIRAGYDGYGGTLTADEHIVVTVGGQPVNGVLRYTIESSLASIGIEPLLSVRVWDRLSLLAGPRLAVVVTKTYEQKEMIVEPTGRGAYYETGTNTRNVSAGDLPQASRMHAAVLAGVRYDVPLNARGTLIAAPEVIASYGITPVLRGITWNASSLRCGISIIHCSSDD